MVAESQHPLPPQWPQWLKRFLQSVSWKTSLCLSQSYLTHRKSKSTSVRLDTPSHPLLTILYRMSLGGQVRDLRASDEREARERRPQLPASIISGKQQHLKRCQCLNLLASNGHWM